MTASPGHESAEFRAADAAGPLDLLLPAAALGPVRAFRPDAATLRLALQLARRPQTVAARVASLAADLAAAPRVPSRPGPGRVRIRPVSDRGGPARSNVGRWNSSGQRERVAAPAGTGAASPSAGSAVY